jgi:hypothetical protein
LAARPDTGKEILYQAAIVAYLAFTTIINSTASDERIGVSTRIPEHKMLKSRIGVRRIE